MNILFGKRLQGNQGEKPKELFPPLQHPLCFGSSLSISKLAEATDKKVQSWVFQTATAKFINVPMVCQKD